MFIKLKNKLELAKAILQLTQIPTDNGVLIADGELAVDVEVFVEGEDGDLIPAPDGIYTSSELVYTVEGGKIVNISNVTNTDPEPEPEPEPTEPEHTEDERDARIAELESKVAELEATIEEKDAKITELEAQLAEANTKIEQAKLSVDKPAERKLDEEVNSVVNPALRIMGAK